MHPYGSNLHVKNRCRSRFKLHRVQIHFSQIFTDEVFSSQTSSNVCINVYSQTMQYIGLKGSKGQSVAKVMCDDHNNQ